MASKFPFFVIKLKIFYYYLYSCGTSAAQCGVVAYGNCGTTACGSGLCCTRYG